MGSNLNADGLFQKFGPTKAVPTTAGEYVTTGQLREIQVKIDLTGLTASEVVQSDQIFFPKMRIAEVEILTHTAAATGTAIDIGLIATDRATEIDYDGLAAAFPTASMDTAGDKVTLLTDTTYNGALIGTTTTSVGYITCSRTDSTAFTTGVIFVKIRYYAV